MQPSNQDNGKQPEESALLRFRRMQAAQGKQSAHPQSVTAQQVNVEKKPDAPIPDKRIISKQPKEEFIEKEPLVSKPESLAKSPKQDKKGIAAIRAELQAQFPQGLGYQLAPYETELALETHLDIANVITDSKQIKEKSQYFCCSICSMVVVDPVECGDCNTAYCRQCLVPWAERGGCCPKRCKRDQPVKLVEMHRYAKADLKAMSFRCVNETCSHKAPYEKAMRHLSECNEKFSACANGCGVGILAKHQKYHDYLQCPKFTVKCETCACNLGFINGEGANFEDKPHNCLDYLKLRIRNLELGIAPGKKADEHVNGYDLAMNFCSSCDGTLRKYVHNPPGYGAARCDRCKLTPINHAAFFFHCDGCQFDLCFHCSLATQGKLPISTMNVHIRRLNKTYVLSQTSPAQEEYPIECCRGNECVSKKNHGHITDHFWYENDRDSEDNICVYCLVDLYEA